MFIPFVVRHDYDRRPYFIWTLAVLVTLVNLFFLLPGWLTDWMIAAKYGEMLQLTRFARDGLQAYNFVTYAVLFPSVWLFLFDMAGLIFFGWAIEACLGWFRTLLILAAAIPAAAFAHGAYQPRFDMAGLTGGVMGLIGAAILIYGFSETDGFALVPVPPEWKLGMTYTWTIFIIMAYIAGAVAWAYFAPRDMIQIISIFGLAGGLLMGAAATVLLLFGQIPILHPGKLDPSTMRRMEDRKRREQVQRELEEDGLFSRTDTEEAPVMSLESAKAEEDELAGRQERSPRSDDLGLRQESLAKMIALKNYAALAQAYQEFSEDFPRACMPAAAQLQLATMLESGYFNDQALDAFERLVKCHPDTPSAEKALLHAGKLCREVPGREMDGIKYLERFMLGDIPRQELIEAQEIMRALRERMQGEAGEEAAPSSEPAVPGPSSVEPSETRSGDEPLRLSGLSGGKHEPREPASPPPAESKKPVAEESPAQEPVEEIVITPARPEPQSAPDLSLPSESEADTVGFEEMMEGPAPARSVSPAASSRTPAESPVPGQRFTLIVAPKTAIDMKVLAQAFGERWGKTEAQALERLRRQKGILEQGLAFEEVVELREECLKKGQRLLMVPETSDLVYGEALDVEAVRFKEKSIEWQAGTQSIETPAAQMRLISAGMARVHPNSDRIRAVLAVYVAEPHVRLRIWETMLHTHEDPALKGLEGIEALKSVALRLAERAPNAQVTHAFQRTFQLEEGMTPLAFEDVEEFGYYNLWNLMAGAQRIQRSVFG